MSDEDKADVKQLAAKYIKAYNELEKRGLLKAWLKIKEEAK